MFCAYKTKYQNKTETDLKKNYSVKIGVLQFYSAYMQATTGS